MTEPHLWDDAACKGKDQRWWFPPLDSLGTTREMLLDQGRAVCRGCPRLTECLDWSLAQNSELQGLWAGLTPHDRMLERRARRRSNDGQWACQHCGARFIEQRSYAAHISHHSRRPGRPPRAQAG